MRTQTTEAIASALVDELGPKKTLELLARAREKDVEQHPKHRNPDFIGMESFVKRYVAGCTDLCGMCMAFSTPPATPQQFVEHLRSCRGSKNEGGR